MKIEIAGINYRKGIDYYVGRSFGYLQPEPTNQHDPNAIGIYSTDGHHLGYVPALQTATIRALGLQFPIPVDVEILQGFDEIERRPFFWGSVYIRTTLKQ